MTELIRQYERDISLLRGRLAELRERAAHGGEDDALRERTELLQQEMYELMYQTAVMRRRAGPKPVTPSLAALTRAGDAAC